MDNTISQLSKTELPDRIIHIHNKLNLGYRVIAKILS